VTDRDSARTSSDPLAPLPDAAQRGLTEHLRRHHAALEAGRGRLGWKVAFNPEAVQQRLGIAYALAAGLTRATLLDPGASYALGGSRRVALEAEVAVRLGRPVAPSDSLDVIARAIAAWAPAIEVVEFDRALDDLEPILAEGVFHRAVTFGPWVEVGEGASLKGLHARVSLGAESVCDVDALEATGDACAVLSHVARLLGPFGGELAPGDVLILGSMNPMTPARANATFRLELSGVGEVALELLP